MDECERHEALETIIRVCEEARGLAQRQGHDFIASLLEAVVNQARADQLRTAPEGLLPGERPSRPH